MKEQFKSHVIKMLNIGKEAVLSNPTLVKETGVVNAKGDRSIEMDVRVEKLFIDYIKKNNLPVNIFSEEIGTVNFHPNPQYLVAFDPLDGSINYKIGRGLLPYGALIAVYNGTEPVLEDVIAVGAIEYTRNLAWVYDGKNTTDLQGNRVHLRQDWPIHRSTPVYLDLYYRDGYKIYTPLAQEIFVRNTGSTIGNLSYVLSNVAAGLGGVCMRAEEIGAVYSLIKGAGGVAVNHKGIDIGKESFSPDTTYPILAGTDNIIQFVVERIIPESK